MRHELSECSVLIGAKSVGDLLPAEASSCPFEWRRALKNRCTVSIGHSNRISTARKTRRHRYCRPRQRNRRSDNIGQTINEPTPNDWRHRVRRNLVEVILPNIYTYIVRTYRRVFTVRNTYIGHIFSAIKRRVLFAPVAVIIARSTACLVFALSRVTHICLLA